MLQARLNACDEIDNVGVGDLHVAYRVRGYSACGVRYARFAERYSRWLRSGIAAPLWLVINSVWFESATQGSFDLRVNVREIRFRQAKFLMNKGMSSATSFMTASREDSQSLKTRSQISSLGGGAMEDWEAMIIRQMRCRQPRVSSWQARSRLEEGVRHSKGRLQRLLCYVWVKQRHFCLL